MNLKYNMKVLIISPSRGLYDSQSGSYNGVGWISSLQQYLEADSDIELGLTFVTPSPAQKEKRGNTMYYPIHIPEKGNLGKLFYYWYGYRNEIYDKSIVHPLKEAINDFKPDIIHIFGTESNLGYILEETNVPCIIHLQGLLCAVYNAYYPMGISEKDFSSVTDIREFWLRNGVIFNRHRMRIAAEREKAHIRKSSYIIGRTLWDREITELYNPDAEYFHVDEVLRQPFYNAEKWKYQPGKLTLVSTLSPTIYKGFDVILKAAKVLQEAGIEFNWNIIGIRSKHSIVRKIEKLCGLHSADLNINYIGIKQPEEMIDILLNATIYVHPSYIDNSPNSLAEAQYLGLPTVATNIGGIPTMMDYNEKHMASPVIPHSLAVRIIKLHQEISEGKYDNTLNIIAQERHNPTKIVEELKKAYRTIIDNRKF